MYGIAPHMLHVWCSCSPSYMRRAGIDLNESLRAGKLDSSGNRSRHCRGRRWNPSGVLPSPRRSRVWRFWCNPRHPSRAAHEFGIRPAGGVRGASRPDGQRHGPATAAKDEVGIARPRKTHEGDGFLFVRIPISKPNVISSTTTAPTLVTEAKAKVTT